MSLHPSVVMISVGNSSKWGLWTCSAKWVLRTTVRRPRGCRGALSVKSTMSASEIKLLGINVILVSEGNLFLDVYAQSEFAISYPTVKTIFMKCILGAIWFSCYLLEFSAQCFSDAATQMVIFLFLNRQDLLLPQDLCTCSPSSFFSLWVKYFLFKHTFRTSGELIFFYSLIICLSPFSNPVYFLYYRFHQLILFCLFLSLPVFCFSSFTESKFCESRNQGHLVLHGTPGA